MAVLSGAAVGATTGGIVGGLVGLEILEIEANGTKKNLKTATCDRSRCG
jgi:hypothetical protein